MLPILFYNSVAMRTPAVRMSGAAPYPYNFITIHPTYTINDPKAVTTIMEEYVTSSKAESGLCYSGFSTTRSKPASSVVGDYAVAPGDKLFVREGHAGQSLRQECGTQGQGEALSGPAYQCISANGSRSRERYSSAHLHMYMCTGKHVYVHVCSKSAHTAQDTTKCP